MAQILQGRFGVGVGMRVAFAAAPLQFSGTLKIQSVFCAQVEQQRLLVGAKLGDNILHLRLQHSANFSAEKNFSLQCERGTCGFEAASVSAARHRGR